MRYMIVVDEAGYKRRVAIRDTDGDEVALEGNGIPSGPPDVRDIDWEALKLKINNYLVDNKLFTWDDLERNKTALNGIYPIIRNQKISQDYFRMAPLCSPGSIPRARPGSLQLTKKLVTRGSLNPFML